MAQFYRQESRWTKRRRFQKELSTALLTATEIQQPNRLHDSDSDECHLPVCISGIATEADILVSDDLGVLDSSCLLDACPELVNSLCPIKNVIADDTEFEYSSDRSVSDCDSDANESDVYQNPHNLADELQDWAVINNISHEAVDQLLCILRKQHHQLPKDSRTLLKTVDTVQVTNLAGGLYHHFGIVTGLAQVIDAYGIDSSVIKLQFNIDGLPLFRSSSAQFWPILCLVTNCQIKEPFIVGLYYGNAKPSSLSDYLNRFIEEFSGVQQNGFLYMGKQYSVILTAVICDAPARAFVKNVKGHTGYHGCDKCVQEGVHFQRRMTFPETCAELRTDESFNMMLDEDHHLGQSLPPLACLNVGMITNFPIDYMHQVCLGVVRKLLYLWIRGPLKTRLPSHSVTVLSDRLIALKSFVPSEFARKPRSVSDLDRWKATELRQFLLYSGPVCLENLLPSEMYCNFMLLSFAIRILLSDEFCVDLVDYGGGLLKQFVEHFGRLYGKEYLSYNVHTLVHLADEVKLHGPLDNISGFIFENYLGKMKKLIRKPQAPLQQVVKRLSEKCATKVNLVASVLQKPYFSGPLPQQFEHYQQYSEYHRLDFKLSVNSKDNCIIIGDRPALVKTFLQHNNEIVVVYQTFKDSKPLCSYPFSSDRLRIFCVRNACNDLQFAPVSEIKSKCVLLRSSDQHHLAVLPLIH